MSACTRTSPPRPGMIGMIAAGGKVDVTIEIVGGAAGTRQLYWNNG